MVLLSGRVSTTTQKTSRSMYRHQFQNDWKHQTTKLGINGYRTKGCSFSFTVARSPRRKHNFRKCPTSVRMNDHYIRPKIALCNDRHTKFWLLPSLRSRLNRERKSSIISTVHWISAMKKFKNDQITSTECLPNSSKKHIYYVKNYLASLDRSWWSQLTTN